MRDIRLKSRLIADEDGWHLKVFVDGKPARVVGSVSHEIQQDAAHYDIGDPREIIADALEEYIKSGSA